MHTSHPWQEHDTLSHEEQTLIGKAISGTISAEEQVFLDHICSLISTGDISLSDPQSMLNQDAFATLDDEKQDKVYTELLTIARFLEHIYTFRNSHDTVSIHLVTLVRQLKDMVNRIEIQNDIFKF